MRAVRSLVVVLVILAGAPVAFADRREGRDTSQLPQFAKDEYFIAFRDGVTQENVALVRAVGATITARLPIVRVVAARVSHPAQLASLTALPKVEYVEPVPMMYRQDLSNSQLVPTLDNGLYGLLTTKANLVHARGVTGAAIRVGVADTGIDYTHPDIAPNYKGGVDTVGATGDTDPWWNNDPHETHGTHVAGTVVAAFNSLGVYGAAYTAHLYHARVLGPQGGTSADVMEGVLWLADVAKCKVINLSLGGGGATRTEAGFYQAIRALGVLVVAATGNSGFIGHILFPAAYPVNIAVGAVDRNNTRASFSNAGQGIDLVAPGVTVLSSVPMGTGSEAYVTAAATHQAFGLEFAGKTEGVTAMLVNCGLGNPGECAAGVAGNIALIQRGSISFADKVFNAAQQGAVAAIIYNNVPGNFLGTLGTPADPNGNPWIPTVSVSDTAGAALVSQVGNNALFVNKVSHWDHYDGTSMATPHVTAVVALIWAANPALPHTTVEQYLFETATDLGPPGFDWQYGRGLVNADAAVAKAGK